MAWRESRKKLKGGGCVWVCRISSRRAAESGKGLHVDPAAPYRQSHHIYVAREYMHVVCTMRGGVPRARKRSP